ncbi:ATP-binding protein [Stutzerimonas tarimensis]|uniref:histidine kinase n=1 Tax=Stutzerimonas tarimensis TaxID=1507735 RepID=A0ABV7T6D6_9GAMM
MATTELERLAALLGSSTACADEPIRTPGSIQPHGFLFVLDEQLRITQLSENVQQWLGVAPEQLIGQTPTAWLDDGPASLVERLKQLAHDEPHPFHVGDLRLLGDRENLRFACTAHRSGNAFILEFEPVERSSHDAAASLYPLVHRFVAKLKHDASVEELCRFACTEFKQITGFGRVMAYRFDVGGNGKVLAETAGPGYDSYLGLCFPASDIPAQARTLYLANRIRVIPTADYHPVGLRAPASGEPLDLSFAGLRSVSPVHLQYMRNMGTQASMSISIVVQGQLWGMISCHDLAPRTVGLQTRTACELLGRILSLQIEARELQALAERQLQLRQLIVRMLSAMADEDSISEGLKAVPDALLGFGGACGAAIVFADQIELIGHTPAAGGVAALVDQLAGRGDRAEVFHSDNLGIDLPGLPGFDDIAGAMALSISELHPHYLIWFRPEVVRTVTWAGQPAKSLDERGVLNPRNSFESWQETSHGTSLPWESVELESARDLRAALLGIVLRKAEELAQLAGELSRSNKELEAFSYSVSHDLRAPLRHIAGYAELLGDFDGSNLSERGLRFLENIGDSARFAGTLVDNLLSFSQMGRAALHLSDVNLEALIEAIRQEMTPDYEGRDIHWKVDTLPIVVADAAFIHLALRNLLSNAIKYTRGREPAVIEVGTLPGEEETILFIRDNGVGFDMEYVGKLFGVFQRLHHVDEFEGTGIGLASVRRIIERHEGCVWAEGAPGQGATFYFSLPRHSYSSVM